MQQTRRSVIKAGGALGLLALAGTALLKPGRAHAAWNQSAFEAKSAIDAMKALGMGNAEESKDIVIRAPDIAENGAVVPIDVTSNIPGTTSISVFIEKNPFPYTGTFDFAAGSVPFVHLRAKMGETSPVRVVVAAGGKHYTTAKEVKVTIGGCGG
ncbi:MAG: thiosulfate oxidation carrier protein SoxY [Betaproteobacteria bacterium]|nr:thiosulfate oxidation carrier protein SoxY [Betaproteobacteria bacterium]MDH4323783.1 thiosulfate oxidation carrier protein SoxY [Betaproteobacteria bacterium]MDH5212098.1 thiosulfate oxidation carrier protein SoxY [Betaproteobacteria bacterium]